MKDQEVFDILFKNSLGVSRYADRLLRSPSSGFPPYNVSVDNRVNPTKYLLELAIAGFSRDQINVKLRKDIGLTVLVIEGLKENESQTTNDDKQYLINNIAARSFKREFTLSNDLTVSNISLIDGILSIQLDVKVPAHVEQILQIS